MKRIVIAVVAAAALTGCGVNERTDVTPLEEQPTPDCLFVESYNVDKADGSYEGSNYQGVYCREEE